MEKSDSIVKLTGALIKAQMELEVVGKNAKNPFFKSKYADLPAIFAEYQRVFLKHGLAVIQIVEGKSLRTTLAHDSGEYVSGLAELLLVKQDPQGLGSAITYMRRYALSAICGIATDDDDGNAGTHGMPETVKKPAPISEPAKPAENATAAATAQPAAAPAVPAQASPMQVSVGELEKLFKEAGRCGLQLKGDKRIFGTFSQPAFAAAQDMKGKPVKITFQEAGGKLNLMEIIEIKGDK